jgi:hypothetical protein
MIYLDNKIMPCDFAIASDGVTTDDWGDHHSSVVVPLRRFRGRPDKYRSRGHLVHIKRDLAIRSNLGKMALDSGGNEVEWCMVDAFHFGSDCRPLVALVAGLTNLATRRN